MIIQENIPLAPYTTFKIGGPARFFCIATKESDIEEAVRFAKMKKRRIIVLGGGSNILVADAGFSGVVIKNEIMGIATEDEPRAGMGEGDLRARLARARGIFQQKNIRAPDAMPWSGESELPDFALVSVGAGEMWDDFVDWAAANHLHGVENLSAIPGTVGAAPVQNIGAYGADVSETIASVRAFDTVEMKHVELTNKECHFEYRDSIFKKEKGRYIITGVDFNLRKDGKVNIEYKDLKEYFAKKATLPSLQEVRKAVIEIRWKKLPDWKLWGTAGSFFKNPIIAAARYEKIKEKYPDIPGFPQSDGRIKVPVGWILDKICHARGAMVGNVGAYEHQALVIVTKPGATASEVVDFAKKLMEQVERETTIKLEGEVEWVN